MLRLDLVDRKQGQWNDDFTLLDLPVPDAEHLDGDIIKRATRFIDTQIASGEAVLVHCNLGVSRSVTVAMAYLIEYEGMSLAEAFGTVREGRPSAYPHELLLIALIELYDLPYDTSKVFNPKFLAELIKDV